MIDDENANEVERAEARRKLEDIVEWARKHLRGTEGGEQRQVRAIRQATDGYSHSCVRRATRRVQLTRFRGILGSTWSGAFGSRPGEVCGMGDYGWQRGWRGGLFMKSL